MNCPLSKFLIIAFFLIINFLSVEAAEETQDQGFGISISPSVIRMTGKVGQSQQATVRVLNNSTIPLQVLTEVNDVGNTLDKIGKLTRQFFPAGTLPYSCAKWILLRENEFSLPPKDYRDINFLISPPADSTGGSACVVFFKGIPSPDQKSNGNAAQPQATIQIQPRLGAMVFYEIEGTVTRTGVLVHLTHEPPTAQKPLKISYVFRNTGNADILISGTFYILDQNKALMTKENLKPIRTFPGDEGIGETEWVGSLAPGRYQLVVTFELGPGTQEVVVKELELSIA